MLRSAGADIEAAGATGATPLQAAVQEGHAEVVRELIAAGADIEARDERGVAVMHLAAGNGHEAVLQAGPRARLHSPVCGAGRCGLLTGAAPAFGRRC